MGQWDMRKLRNLFSAQVAKQISVIFIFDAGYKDELIWGPSPSSEFSMKSTYHTLISLSLDQVSAKPELLVPEVCWSLPVPYKMQFMLWQVLWNCLPTRNNLYKRYCSASNICYLCENVVEAITNLLLECPLTPIIWFGSPSGCRFYMDVRQHFSKWFCEWLFEVES